jgi:hypothetical protein
MDGKSGQPADILIVSNYAPFSPILLVYLTVIQVAHGHILRAFTKRWLRYAMDFPFLMMMEPGAIGIMSYAHHNVEEPAILVGMGFPLSQ